MGIYPTYETLLTVNTSEMTPVKSTATNLHQSQYTAIATPLNESQYAATQNYEDTPTLDRPTFGPPNLFD